MLSSNQLSPESLRSVDELLNQHNSYNIGAGFYIRKSRNTGGLWAVYLDAWEVSYLLTAQFQKPRTDRSSIRFETVTEAVQYAENVLSCPKSMKALEAFRETATVCSDRRRA